MHAIEKPNHVTAISEIEYKRRTVQLPKWYEILSNVEDRIIDETGNGRKANIWYNSQDDYWGLAVWYEIDFTDTGYGNRQEFGWCQIGYQSLAELLTVNQGLVGSSNYDLMVWADLQPNGDEQVIQPVEYYTIRHSAWSRQIIGLVHGDSIVNHYPDAVAVDGPHANEHDCQFFPRST